MTILLPTVANVLDCMGIGVLISNYLHMNSSMIDINDFIILYEIIYVHYSWDQGLHLILYNFCETEWD